MTILISKQTDAAISDSINMIGDSRLGYPQTFRVTGGALGAGEYVKLQYYDGAAWRDANVNGDDGKILDEDNAMKSVYGHLPNVRVSKSVNIRCPWCGGGIMPIGATCGPPLGAPVGPPLGALAWENLGPFPPENVTAAVDGTDIDITWNTASCVDSYNVYQSIDGGDWTLLDNEETTSYSLTPTEPGEYNFYVTSVRGSLESAASTKTTTTEDMMVEVYSDTISDMRISAVDGTAFVDAASDITGYADGNHLLEVTDSEGKVLSGVLKDQGSGETLGSEIFTDPTLDAGCGNGFTCGNGWSMADGQATHIPGNNGSLYTGLILDNGKLHKLSVTVSTFTAGSSLNLLFEGIQGNNITVIGEHSIYQTTSGVITVNGIRADNGDEDVVIDDLHLKQVTAPSTNGATLVNEISGTTQNLFDVEDGFAFNEASYDVVVKQILPT